MVHGSRNYLDSSFKRKYSNVVYFSTGGLLRSNPTSPTPPQVSADPFADLGGTFSMNQSAATQEPLYAVVDKSQKINPNVNQESSDLFGIFDGNTSATEASSGTLATSTSEQVRYYLTNGIKVGPLLHCN